MSVYSMGVCGLDRVRSVVVIHVLHAAEWVRVLLRNENSMLMHSSGIAPGQCIIASDFHTFEAVGVAYAVAVES